MAEMLGDSIEVEVAYALPDAQTVVTLTVPSGTTVQEAVSQSGIAAKHPEIDWNRAAIGIFGERVSVSTALKDHDRIEIYRPLIADPKQVRRNRARGRNTKGR